MLFFHVYFSSILTRGLAELFFRVWQSRRMHHRSGRRRQVARLCVPHLRGPRISQRSHDPGTLPRRKGCPCTYVHLSVSENSLTVPVARTD
jgi:hypothetical protein